MSTAYYDLAQELRLKPGIQLASKGSAGWDRVYIEQATYDTSKARPNYPTEAAHTLPDGRTPGNAHPKCPYLTLVDAYVSGGDDHRQNWVLTYRLDIMAFVKAFPDAAPDGDWQKLMCRDGVQTTFPAEDNSPDIIWAFTIINPDSYIKPVQGTAHPLDAGALFINETHQRDGQTLLVTRNYHKVAPYSTQQRIGYTLTGEYLSHDILTWTYETPHSAYTVPAVNAPCTIPGHILKRVIKPPEIEIINGLNRRVTITYGSLPGPVITTSTISNGPAGEITTYTQRRAMADSFSSACLSFNLIESNGYSKTWQYTTPTPRQLTSWEYDTETGKTFEVTEQIVSASSNGSDINPFGQFVTISPINRHYAIRRTSYIPMIQHNIKMTSYFYDEETRDLITEVTEIVNAGDEPHISIGKSITQKPINERFSARVTRSIDGTPTDYERLIWVDFDIPSILNGIDAIPAGDKYIINYNVRHGYQKKLRGRVVVDFFNREPNPQTLLEIRPSGQVYNGLSFSLNLQGMLVDAQTIGSSGSELVEQVNLQPSQPTKSDYLYMIGSEYLISEKTSLFWTGHVRRESVYVTLE